MIDGTTIFHSDTGTDAYYTPPFPRGGLAATFTVDVTHIRAATSLTFVVGVEHKNSDDTTWAGLATLSNITSTGVATKDVSGIKEQVRLSFTFSTGVAGDFVHIIAQAPSWRLYP